MTVIEVQNLSKRYGETLAVNGISFEIEAGKVVGFLGPNGAGKTTTLRILTSYLPPSSGTVRVAGHDTLEDSLEVRRLIGYLPENNPLYEDLETAEYLEWAAEVRGISGERKTSRIKEVVRTCGLKEVIGKDIGRLSKGYRQRVGLAGAILHDPPILLLDEPTSGLDPNQTREVRDLILELKKHKTVLLSTHILSEVQASCDEVIILHQGKIAASGTPQSLAHAQGSRICVTFRSEGLSLPETAQAILKISGVSSVQTQEQNGEVTLEVLTGDAEHDIRGELFRIAAEKNWPLLELKRERASLEEVFRQLTT